MLRILMSLALAGFVVGPNAIAAAPEPTVESLLQQTQACEDFECPPLKALIAQGARVWPDLQWGLAPERDELVRFWALGVLSEVRVEDSRAPLEALMAGDKLVRIRAAAAFALGNLGGEAALTPLVAALKDKDVNVRFEATSALGRVPDKAGAAAKPLRKMLRDKDADVRAAAVDALGLLRDQASFDAVLRRLSGDSAAVVRGHAAVSLANTGRQEVVAPLIKRLAAEKDVEALSAACWALGELRATSAIPALSRLAGHKHPTVAKHATEAIDAIRTPPTPPEPKPGK